MSKRNRKASAGHRPMYVIIFRKAENIMVFTVKQQRFTARSIQQDGNRKYLIPTSLSLFRRPNLVITITTAGDILCSAYVVLYIGGGGGMSQSHPEGRPPWQM